MKMPDEADQQPDNSLPVWFYAIGADRFANNQKHRDRSNDERGNSRRDELFSPGNQSIAAQQ